MVQGHPELAGHSEVEGHALEPELILTALCILWPVRIL